MTVCAAVPITPSLSFVDVDAPMPVALVPIAKQPLPETVTRCPIAVA